MQGQCLSSLLSLLFSPGEGVGSKALTHQQVPFSPFISSLSSQLPLFLFSSLPSAPLFSVHLPCLFSSSPPHCYCLNVFPSSPPLAFSFLFPFWICDLCPLFPCNPLSSVSLSLSYSSPCLFISSLCIFPLSSHAFSSYTLFPPPLLPFYPPFPRFFRSLLTFSLSPFSHLPQPPFPSLRLFLSLDYTLLSLFSEKYILKSGGGGGEKRRRRGENKAP